MHVDSIILRSSSKGMGSKTCHDVYYLIEWALFKVIFAFLSREVLEFVNVGIPEYKSKF